MASSLKSTLESTGLKKWEVSLGWLPGGNQNSKPLYGYLMLK